jgi:hypothetical protein
MLILLAAAASAVRARLMAEDMDPLPPSPPCLDDPTYSQHGVGPGSVPTTWTSCKNWTGYTCRYGGWGIQEPADIDYLVASCPMSCSDGRCCVDRCEHDHTYSYDQEYSSSTATVCDCPIEWRGDGECDRQCNHALCNFDEQDCFHNDPGCYEQRFGADYRGNVSRTREGKRCQFWDSQWPNVHRFTVSNYPDANLGGHNSCRNPEPEDGSTGPWCIIDTYSDHEDGVWDYCDVGEPSTAACPNPHLPPQHNHTKLKLGVWQTASVYENQYNYYALALPPNLRGFKALVVPLEADERGGDPNLFLSFDVPFPTGHDYAYKQDGTGVEVFEMTQGTYGYCGDNYTSGAPCTLYLSVTAFETSTYHLVVLDTASEGGTLCADGCAWKQLGDGECQLQCNVSVRGYTSPRPPIKQPSTLQTRVRSFCRPSLF